MRRASGHARTPAAVLRQSAQAAPGIGKKSVSGRSTSVLSDALPATRTIQQRRPPLRKKARTAGPRCPRSCSPRWASQASGKSSPKISWKYASSSTTTGMWSGPAEAKPTNTAISMRGNTSPGGGVSTSKRKPGSRRGRFMIIALRRAGIPRSGICSSPRVISVSPARGNRLQENDHDHSISSRS